MIPLTREEVAELRLAIAARARAMPHGSEPHQVCVGLLDKLQPEQARPSPNLTAPLAAFVPDECVESWR